MGSRVHPSAHPTLPDYIHKTDVGGFVLKAPSVPAPFDAVYKELDGTCFGTDNRTFGPDINASARITVDFTVQIRDMEMTIPARDLDELGLPTTLTAEVA